MSLPADLRYTKNHEWVRVEGDVAVVGITDFAQSQLGDLTFVELPTAGDIVAVDDDVAVVESVKAASDVYAPVSGTIEEGNSDLEMDPSLINTDPFGQGWLFKIKLANPADLDGLLSAEEYARLIPG